MPDELLDDDDVEELLLDVDELDVEVLEEDVLGTSLEVSLELSPGFPPQAVNASSVSADTSAFLWVFIE